jgi:hypothetical protein
MSRLRSTPHPETVSRQAVNSARAETLADAAGDFVQAPIRGARTDGKRVMRNAMTTTGRMTNTPAWHDRSEYKANGKMEEVDVGRRMSRQDGARCLRPEVGCIARTRASEPIVGGASVLQ